jgi:DNA polymerase-3 subunit alpha
LLDGACRIPDLVAAAVEFSMPAVAMTDHGVMHGTVEFYKAAKAAGVKPILGCEVYVAPGSRHDRGGTDARREGPEHLVLLAADGNGYRNLVRLVSQAHLEGFYYKPRIDRELLAAHAGGLIGLSACLKGRVAERLAGDDEEGAVREAGAYAEILGRDNFFLEVMDHGLPEEQKVLAAMPRVARRTGLRIAATNDVHYLLAAHSTAHEVLLCLQTGTLLSDPKRMRYAPGQFHLKTRDEMEPLLRRFPGCDETVLEIAGRCNVELDLSGMPHFPAYDTPRGEHARDMLRRLALEGLARRFRMPAPEHPADEKGRAALERLNHELAIIEHTHFVNYFLVVWDFVRFAREQRIPVGPGRGSGGGSLVAYCLGITDIDPLHYDLIFERFLNPQRKSPPDFDIDFCMDRRDEVIAYVTRKYGDDRVARIITFGSLGAKLVIRDVGRVLEVPFAACDRIAKLVPDDPKIRLESALRDSPEFRAAHQNDPDCRRILEHALVLEGLFRNAATHAAGLVIGDRPLVEILPLCRDKDNHQVMTQFAMGPVAELGLLKMDFLGLKTLTVLQEAADLVRELRGVETDFATLPLDDEAAFRLMARGDTVGVFQLESAGMRDLAKRLNPGCIEDVIAMIALYRPGPMSWIDTFVERHHGKQPVSYDHPLLEPVLKETRGIMLYQEQVQRAANVLAGFSLGDADDLRRAMSKKKDAEMDRKRAAFIDGCKKAHNIPTELAAKIFENIEPFARYGFNKSHSVGYAIVSYRTAYMKAHYPAEYASALLSNEIGNSEKLSSFIAATVAGGVKVLQPDVNRSEPRFRPDGEGAVRFGLAGVKNVGAGAAAAIAAERRANGPFSGLVDLCARVDGQVANKKVIESLIRSGACDGFGLHRARLFNGVDFAMARAASRARDRAAGQGSLFDALDEKPAGMDERKAEPPDCPPWHPSEMLAAERELLGMYLTGHPLTQYQWLIEKYQLSGVAGLAALQEGAVTRVGGILAKVQKKVTKQKQMMAYATLEDLDGTVEVVVFPDCYEAFSGTLRPDAAVLVCGEVSRREGAPQLVAREFYPLTDAPRHFTEKVAVHIPSSAATDERLAALKKIFTRHPGTVPVMLCLVFPAGEKVFIRVGPDLRVLPSHEFIGEAQREFGEDAVYVGVRREACLRPRAGRRWNGGGRGE